MFEEGGWLWCGNENCRWGISAAPLDEEGNAQEVMAGQSDRAFAPTQKQVDWADFKYPESKYAGVAPGSLASLGDGSLSKYVTSSGASRSEKAPRHHLIPPDAYKAWVDRMALGEKAHGSFNWLKGQDDEEFQIETWNHLKEHLRKFEAGEGGDDEHLAAVICGAAFLLQFKLMGKLKLRFPWWGREGR